MAALLLFLVSEKKSGDVSAECMHLFLPDWRNSIDDFSIERELRNRTRNHEPCPNFERWPWKFYDPHSPFDPFSLAAVDKFSRFAFLGAAKNNASPPKLGSERESRAGDGGAGFWAEHRSQYLTHYRRKFILPSASTVPAQFVTSWIYSNLIIILRLFNSIYRYSLNFVYFATSQSLIALIVHFKLLFFFILVESENFCNPLF